jgi:hypothetical protein
MIAMPNHLYTKTQFPNRRVKNTTRTPVRLPNDREATPSRIGSDAAAEVVEDVEPSLPTTPPSSSRREEIQQASIKVERDSTVKESLSMAILDTPFSTCHQKKG